MVPLRKIICQKCKDIPEREMKGCMVCGGSKELLVRLESVCAICKRPGWVRTGVFSKYEGQQYRTFDGIEMISHLKKPDNCLDCETT